MKTSKLIVGTLATVLSLMIPDAATQAPPGRFSPYAIFAESPLKGVVVNATAIVLTVNGEVKLVPRHTQRANGNAIPSKTERQDIEFSIKNARITRDGKPCDPKSIRKGDSATIEFTSPKQGSSKFIATKVDLTSRGSGNSER
ncbi:MAG: hypothetical protein HZA88_20760 [Verrucomicrobia bacterium]|nr:hypothetical protein [Verrucomicrobiota bacterium]